MHRVGRSILLFPPIHDHAALPARTMALTNIVTPVRGNRLIDMEAKNTRRSALQRPTLAEHLRERRISADPQGASPHIKDTRAIEVLGRNPEIRHIYCFRSPVGVSYRVGSSARTGDLEERTPRMPCTVSEEQLFSWLDRGASELDEHVAECVGCRERTYALKDRIDLVRQAKPEAIPLPPRISGYRFCRHLGQGGTGVVYEAEQDATGRIVAIKVLRSSMDESQRTRLFRREARILARLKHPGIAAVYDAGTTHDGQPYIVMECVSGVPIGHLAASGDTSRKQLLQLFRDACRAVAYAHDRGVIHRDLKPGHIMIDDERRPRILDFGLARLTASDFLDTRDTTIGRIMGTVAYMSPEQVAGDVDGLDGRSDVYALGVILYELLTGRLPYPITQHLPQAACIIREQPPCPPGQVDRSLRGALQKILIKALEKRPADRYQSAGALADDLDRFLHNFPVRARARSYRHKAREFAVRHKFACTFLAFVLVGLAALVGWIGALDVRARTEATKAAYATDFAREMIALLERHRGFGDIETVHRLLNDSERYIDAELTDYPDVESAVRSSLGDAFFSLGMYDRSARQCALVLALARAEGNDLSVARALLKLSKTREYQRKYDASLALLHESLAIHQESVGVQHPDTLAVQCEVAQMLVLQGKLDEAWKLADESIRGMRQALDSDDLRLASGLNCMGIIWLGMKEFDCAINCLAESVDIYSTHGEHEWSVRVKIRLAEAQRQSGDYRGAEQTARIAWATAKTELGEQHSMFSGALFLIGRALVDQGRLFEAEKWLRQAVEVAEAYYHGRHYMLDTTLFTYAGVLWAQGRYEESERRTRKLLAVSHESDVKNDLWRFGLRNSLAVILRDQGKYVEAEAFFEEAIEIAEQHYGSDSLAAAMVRNNLARLDLLSGRFERAEELILDVLRIRRRDLPADHDELIESKMVLGMVLSATGRLEEAASHLERVLDHRVRRLGENHALTAEAKSAMADCLIRSGRPETARCLLWESWKTLEEKVLPCHKLMRLTAERLARLHETRREAELAAGYRRYLATCAAEPTR